MIQKHSDSSILLSMLLSVPIYEGFYLLPYFGTDYLLVAVAAAWQVEDYAEAAVAAVWPVEGYAETEQVVA